MLPPSMPRMPSATARGAADDPRGGRAAGDRAARSGRSAPRSATIPAAPLVLIDVRTNEGVVGRSYLFAYTQVALARADAASSTEIGAELRGRAVAPVERMARVRPPLPPARLAGAGRHGGLRASTWRCGTRWRAPSTSRSRSCSAAQPTPLPAYDSFGMIDPKADEAAIRASLDQGFRAIKIKIGGGTLERRRRDRLGRARHDRARHQR